jgi:serine kinase of HPr protein (carbohydrate metabolism regulator)
MFRKISMMPRGLVLVTGPTGSGKSTTLAAMVDYINDNFHHHILTIEDPIEFVHENKKLPGQPAGSAPRYQELFRRPALCTAGGPGHHPGGRDA